MKKIIGIVCLFLGMITNSQAWNAIGHKLVAQIAYDKLTPEARELFNGYNQDFSMVFPSTNFITSACWLDAIRSKDNHWFDTLHYIDQSFSKDGTPLVPIPHINALWGIKQALAVLSSPKASSADKGLSLRVLIHVIGDIHQPLHTVTQVSKKYPKGDLGGNLFFLAKNPIGKNLHQYWDNGGGLLKGRFKIDKIKSKATQFSKKWACDEVFTEKSPQNWINESRKIAFTQAYTIKPNTIPNKNYQHNAKKITQQQIYLAGCRVATVLNQIAKG